MPLQVTLLGGSEVDVAVRPGDSGRELRAAVASALNKMAGCVRLLVGDVELSDDAPVPDGTVNAMVCSMPWLDDGSGCIEDDGGSGKFTVKRSAKRGENSYNALCDVGQASGEMYFEIEVLSYGAFVGVTTKAGFGPGVFSKPNSLQGLLFGGPGNLSDGRGLARMSFGGHVLGPMTIGVLADLSDPASVMVVFWQDGQCLGPAFTAPRSQPGAEIFPVVSAREGGDEFSIRLGRCPHDSRERSAAYLPRRRLHAAEGTWRLRRLRFGPELREQPLAELTPERPLTMQARCLNRQPMTDCMGRPFKGRDSPDAKSREGRKLAKKLAPPPEDGSLTFHLNVKVYDEARAAVKAWPAAEGVAPSPFERLDMDVRNDGAQRTGPPGPPDVMEVQRMVTQGLRSVDRWLASGDEGSESLVMAGPEAELTFERWVEPPVADVRLP